MSPTADPYDAIWSTWLADAQRLGQLRRASSRAVYAHMWNALAEWGRAHRLAPLDLNPGHLHSYLAERSGDDPLSLRYAWRLIHLLDRVLAHHCRLHRLPSSTSCGEFLARRPDIQYANASHADDLPDVLSPGQAAQLLRHLRRGLREQASAPAAAWQRLRNLTAVALHFGAGIGPGSLRAIHLNHIEPQPAAVRWPGPMPVLVRIPASGNSPAHTATVDRWARRYLGLWLQRRAEWAIPGPMLLPSTRSSGKPWGKVAHYEAINKVLAEAGIVGGEGGAYRLRHSYALHRLGQGMAVDELQRRLGVSDPKVLERYQALHLYRTVLPGQAAPAGVQ